jgi:hypothetical protein
MFIKKAIQSTLVFATFFSLILSTFSTPISLNAQDATILNPNFQATVQKNSNRNVNIRINYLGNNLNSDVNQIRLTFKGVLPQNTYPFFWSAELFDENDFVNNQLNFNYPTDSNTSGRLESANTYDFVFVGTNDLNQQIWNETFRVDINNPIIISPLIADLRSINSREVNLKINRIRDDIGWFGGGTQVVALGLLNRRIFVQRSFNNRPFVNIYNEEAVPGGVIGLEIINERVLKFTYTDRNLIAGNYRYRMAVYDGFLGSYTFTNQVQFSVANNDKPSAPVINYNQANRVLIANSRDYDGISKTVFTINGVRRVITGPSGRLNIMLPKGVNIVRAVAYDGFGIVGSASVRQVVVR